MIALAYFYEMYYFIIMLFFVLFCYYMLEYVETLLVNIQDVVLRTSEHELCVSWRKRVLEYLLPVAVSRSF